MQKSRPIRRPIEMCSQFYNRVVQVQNYIVLIPFVN